MNENTAFQLKCDSGRILNPEDVAFVVYSQVLNMLYVKLNNNTRDSIQICVLKRQKSILQNWLDNHKIYYPPEDFQ